MWSFSDRTICFCDGIEVRLANFSLHPTYAGCLMGIPQEDQIRDKLVALAHRVWEHEALIFMGSGHSLGGDNKEWPCAAVLVQFMGPSMLFEGEKTHGTYAHVVWLTDCDIHNVFTLVQQLVDQTELRWENIRKPDWFD